MKKLLSCCLILCIMFGTMGATYYWPGAGGDDEVIAEEDEYTFRILEIAPTEDDFVLEEDDFYYYNAKLYSYTIKEYNAIREDMVGKYDIIYISDGEDYNYGYGYNYGHGHNNWPINEAKYYTLGEPVNKLPTGQINGSMIWAYDPNTPVLEYWPGNDATELVIGYMANFIDADQLVIADKRLSEMDTSTSRINAFVSDYQSEIMEVSAYDAAKEIRDLLIVEDYSQYATPRPYMNVINHPKYYDGTEASYIDTSNGATINFELEIMGYESESTYRVDFYFDNNGDNKYYESDNELIKTRSNILSTEKTTMSIVIPEDMIGLFPYKLEVTDLKTNAKNYVEGYLGFRGNEPVVINCLQVSCNGNTFDLSKDFVDSNGDSLLTDFSDAYIINVDVITMSQYKKLYKDPDFKLTEYVNSNGDNYNMILYGFADVYGGEDLSDERMANDLKDFINTGQSVMFTHDTLTFRVDNENGWGRGFTRYFRDFVGQNMYWQEDFPNPNYITLGFSKEAFNRAEYGNFKTTNNVYAFNDGIMTNYPFNIVKGGVSDLYDMTFGQRLLSVATTHYQYYQLDLNNEDVVVWYTLTGGTNDHLDPANYYYTYSIGNVTYSGTGHTNLNYANSFQERKLFANTIIKAARGANFAPNVYIQGLSDKKEISRSTETLKFSIMASDPDVEDQYLNGMVYLDKNNDGDFTEDEIIQTYDIEDRTTGQNSALLNNVPRDIELDLRSLDEGISSFSIKVVARDSKGALGSEVYEFPLVDEPGMSLFVRAPGGMLVGDKVTITTEATLDVPKLSRESLIENIALQSGIYEDEDMSTIYSVELKDEYIVGDYSDDYSIEGKLLKTPTTAIRDLKPGVMGTIIEEWSYTIEAKDDKELGRYYLSSKLNYHLHDRNMDKEVEAGKPFEIKRGTIEYVLYNDLGAPINEAMDAQLFYFEHEPANINKPDLSQGKLVSDVTVTNGKIIFGEEGSIDMKTGYYALNILGSSGYGSMRSEATYLDYMDNRQVVDLTLSIEPLSTPLWVHKGAKDRPGVKKAISVGEAAQSQLYFSTYIDMEGFELDYRDDNDQRDMTMAIDAVICEKDDGTSIDVTSSFDVTDSQIIWRGEDSMPQGDYVITFTHRFKSGTSGGKLEAYLIDSDDGSNLHVTVLDSGGNKQTMDYTFEDIVLYFISSIEIM